MSLPEVGARADYVLRMEGRSEDRIVANPKVVGRDDCGLVVEWQYPDCTLTLSYRDGQYRVAEVK